MRRTATRSGAAATRIVVFGLVLAALPVPAESPPPAAVPLPPLVRHATEAGPALVATLPGAVLAVAPLDGSGRPGGALAVLLSSDADNGPRSVVLVEPRSRRVTTLAEKLPEALATLAALPDGGLAVGDGERLHRLAPNGGLVALGTARGVDPKAVTVAGGGPLPWLPVARAGRLELVGAGGAVLAAREVPLEAARRRWGLEVLAPRVTVLPGTGDDPAVWAAGPYPLEPAGPGSRRRLRSVFGELGGTGARREAWARLPSEEFVADAAYGRLDGRPALAVATIGEIGLLAKRRCRLYVLAEGAPRTGAPPILAFETRAALWHEIDLVLGDADGDGRSDLVLVHPQGMDGDELRVETHRRRPDGGGFARPVATVLRGPATAWHFGDDLDGDRLPDLLVARRGRLSLHPGAREGRRPVARRPAWEVPLDGGGSGREIALALAGERPAADAPAYRLRLRAVVDADGDRRPEVVLAGPPADGWSRLVIVGRD